MGSVIEKDFKKNKWRVVIFETGKTYYFNTIELVFKFLKGK